MMWRMVAVAALGLLVNGCGGGGDSGARLDTRDLADFERSLWSRTEDLIVECMRAYGFAYEPRPHEGPKQVRSGVSPFELTLTEEQARSSGFGLVDGLIADSVPTPSDEDDPNEHGSLSEGEQSAWNAALDGGLSADTPGGRSQAEAAARKELAADVKNIEGRLIDVGQRVEADPRYAQLWAQWSGCMAEEGIAAANLDKLTLQLAEEAAELIAPPHRRGELEEQPEPKPHTAGQPPDPQAVARLRVREVAAATAAVRWLEPLRPAYEEIVADAERANG